MNRMSVMMSSAKFITHFQIRVIDTRFALIRLLRKLKYTIFGLSFHLLSAYTMIDFPLFVANLKTVAPYTFDIRNTLWTLYMKNN